MLRIFACSLLLLKCTHACSLWLDNKACLVGTLSLLSFFKWRGQWCASKCFVTGGPGEAPVFSVCQFCGWSSPTVARLQPSTSHWEWSRGMVHTVRWPELAWADCSQPTSGGRDGEVVLIRAACWVQAGPAGREGCHPPVSLKRRMHNVHWVSTTFLIFTIVSWGRLYCLYFQRNPRPRERLTNSASHSSVSTWGFRSGFQFTNCFGEMVRSPRPLSGLINC